ncbi:putative ABC transporter permease subunit [Candidatus Contubernalis alkaliaceticus]|uniref:putative ABC transporter permease subunit n=1 Tax=Candidatus Contubernalis alkaliaceticus TaxID=338645 RepID=UPI001F4BF7F6|nr:hypothetical protein [Candidatus Contubernalis alkalaceticus]UNC90824.1 hypothetical protein HUE98_01225 [Candidatus Contubernalis alkalaceticus]
MNYILWFLKLRFLTLKNSLWKDAKTIMRTLIIAALILCAQFLLAYLLKKYIFSSVIPANDAQVRPVLLILFFVAVIWIYFIAFFQSISNFVRHFLKSPDLNYLISIPVPLNYVFLFKYSEYIINSIKGIIFVVFPFLAAIGLSVKAPWFYYAALIPFYIIVSVIPCTIGVGVAMVGVRILSSKAFGIISSIISFVINIVFVVLFSRVQEISPDHIIRIVEFMQKPLMSDLIPVTAGTRLFYSTVFGENFLQALVFLLIISAFFVAAAFVLSKKLFFEVWVKNQTAVAAVHRKSTTASKYNKESNSSVIFQWIKGEWRMAIRNQEMLMGCVFMLMFFLFTTFIFVYKGYFSTEPMLGLYILISVASIFNIMAVSIPFLPIEIASDKGLWKNRLWLLKVMPLEGGKVFDIQCIMFLIPGYIISLAGIICYSIINGLSFPVIFLSALVLKAILYGSSAIYNSVELLALTEFFEKNAFLGNLLTIILPVFYGVLSAGTIALFFAEDFISDVRILSGISRLLSLPVTVAVSVATVLAASFAARKIFKRAWEHLEI